MSDRLSNFNKSFSSKFNAGWSKINKLFKQRNLNTKSAKRILRSQSTLGARASRPLRLIHSTIPFQLRSITILSTLVCLILTTLLLSPLCSAQAPPAAPEKRKVEFTKIQDLSTTAKAINRPVRQKWAVVIGISNFLDRRLDSNDGYNKAARDFAAYLESPKGGRFRADHLRLLTDEKATQQSINNSFSDSWLGKHASEDDLVVIYLATRSFPTTDGNSYLCSYNCSLDNIFGSCLSIQSLMQTIRRNVKSDRIVLVLESAYSGAANLGSQSKKSLPNFNLDLDKVSLGKGFVVLSSSRSDQLSWKTLFTENLIAALKEKGGFVALDEAFGKSRQQTEFDSINRIYMGRKQTPQMKSDWQGNDLIIGCEALESNAGIPESMLTFIGAEAHYLKANQAIINSDLEGALPEYQAAIKADPGLADARADYAVALGMKGSWKEAEEELRKAIALRPEDPLYLANYARVLDKLGEKEECKRMLEKAYSINPKDRVVLVALSDKCIAAGEKEAAMTLIDQAVVLYPENAIVQDRMSFLLSLDGRVDEAFAHAKEAVKLDPELTSARLKLGALYVLRGDLSSAIKEYQTVLSKNDKNPDAHFLLAEAFDKSKDQRTVEEFKRFLQLAPESDKRRTAVQDRLRALGSPGQFE